MKRFLRLLFSFMLLLLFSLSTGHSSAHPVSYSIPDIGIDMLDQQVDNHALSYPIVMNTKAELDLAFEEYHKGTFIKHSINLNS